MMGQRSGGRRQLFYSFNLDDHVPWAITCCAGLITFSTSAICGVTAGIAGQLERGYHAVGLSFGYRSVVARGPFVTRSCRRRVSLAASVGR